MWDRYYTVISDISLQRMLDFYTERKVCTKEFIKLLEEKLRRNEID